MKKENKVALITGSGAKRIGNHIAFALAEEGFDIAVHYNTSHEEAAETVNALKKKYTINVAAYQANLTNEQEVKGLVQKVFDDFGSIDVLINTAAAYKKILFEKITGSDVLFFFKVNTLSTFLCSKYVGEKMIKQKEGGIIINFADWAIERPYVNYAAYFPSKGAIPTMTRSLAQELGKRNPRVRVNCISPGPMMLPPDMPKEEKEKAIAQTIVKREGSLKNISLAVIHFIENDFVTGQNLNVDGGRGIFSNE
ncbi:MAG: SDR family oxidoreductase [Nanoarchaeota archaeon]